MRNDGRVRVHRVVRLEVHMTYLVAILLELALCVALVAIESVALAAVRPIPENEWTSQARDVLANVLAVEGCNGVDRAAIPNVLARRWRMQRRGWSFAETCRRYSAPVRLGRIKRPATEQERAFLDAWARGEIADPCAGAVHFASPTIVSLNHPLRVCRNARNVFLRAAR